MDSIFESHCERCGKSTQFVERFVYDVLAYTLTKCGFPETCLPKTECTENVYRRTDIVQVAGASVLRISLIMRDKWKRMFISRRNSSGFNDKDVLMFLVKLVLCCPHSRLGLTQSLVELLLASSNEIIMYFHLESMDIDFNSVIKSIGVYIMGITSVEQRDPEEIQELFGSFDDISKYTEWISNFITKFAIPYGSRDDVSDLFFDSVEKKFKDDVRKLKEDLRFLPHELFLAITVGESEKSTSVPKEGKSSEPTKLTTSSEVGAMGGKKSCSSQTTSPEKLSQHFAESEQSGNISSKLEVEHDLRKMSLDIEASHDTPGTSKRKTDEN